mmetsp:Transcript_103618/g.302412  ORF Transcript_103618/g.302412 Transcript_103618/m.302412 type:complete len:810 (-) Transcript_103618:22-2451(-)
MRPEEMGGPPPRHKSLEESGDVRRSVSERGNRRMSVDFADLLSPEDLGVAFAIRVASQPPTMKPLAVLVKNFTKVMPESEDSDAPPRRIPLAGRFGQGFQIDDQNIRQRVKRACKGLREQLTSRRLQSLLVCSAVLSGFWVMAGLAVEPICLPPEAGSPFRRLSQGADDFYTRLMLLQCVQALLASFTALTLQALHLLRPKSPAKPIAGDLTNRALEVRKTGLWAPSLWLELLGFGGVLAEVVHLTEAEAGVPTISQWLMLLQVLKCHRLAVSESMLEPGSLMQGFAKVLFSLLVFAHVMTTVLMVIGSHENSWGETSWLDSLQGGYNHRDDCAVLWVDGWYFAVLSLTSVGYGDLLVTPLERGVNSMFLLLSQLYTAKVCADLTWITSTHNHWEAKHQAQRAQAFVALQHMKVPHVLVERVLAFQNYVATVLREDLTQPAFEGLSENLMMELRLCAYRKLVLTAPFLREQPKDVMTFIVGALKDNVFLPGDVIVRSGDTGRELFFMRRGKAQVYVGADPPIWGYTEPVASYVVGNYFGELGMLTGHPRKAWIMAEVYSVCSVLQYSAVEQLMHQYPGAFTSLVQAMVRQYQLKATLTWDHVTARIEAKYGFNSCAEAFCWFCSNGQSSDDDELGARAFEESLTRLKVPALDRKILWAEIDQDNSGFVSLDEFSQRIAMNSDRSNVRKWSNQSVSRQLTGDFVTTPSNWRQPSLARCFTTEIGKAQERETMDVLTECRKEIKESREQAKRLTEEVNTLKLSLGSKDTHCLPASNCLPGSISTPTATRELPTISGFAGDLCSVTPRQSLH